MTKYTTRQYWKLIANGARFRNLTISMNVGALMATFLEENGGYVDIEQTDPLAISDTGPLFKHEILYNDLGKLAMETYTYLVDVRKVLHGDAGLEEFILSSYTPPKGVVKRCTLCGKLFIATNRNANYCTRINASGLPCSANGPLQKFQKKMETDEALKIYNRAYKTHYARVKKCTMSEEDFRSWYSEAKVKLQQARDGELDIDTFQKWLKI